MKNSFYIQKALFLLSLISSITICLSSSSFISMWMSMEINLFSMIPILSTNQKNFSEKSTMMYFLIQSISSSIILISISMNLKFFKNITNFLIYMAIFLKLGMFPFHFWMISVIEGLEWNTAFIIMTIQKIIPISVLMMFMHQKIIILFCLMSSTVAAISGITMFSMRKILGFSSINHLSMMMISLILSKKVFKMYFLIYSLMTFSTTKHLKLLNINLISQSMTFIKLNKTNNLSIMILFLSLAGMPPLLGFLPKMITILLMIKSNMMFTTLLILNLNTLSTYFYLRLSINNILMNLNMKKTFSSSVNVSMPFYLIMSPLYLIFM
uniref:NADH dehydrogenase subunit 2 n=1 Tax=Stenchaetothrips biformis TaxID=1100830 RepID=UPI0030DE0EEE